MDPNKQLAPPQKILRAKDVKPDANATVSLNIDDKEQVATSALSERTRRKRSKNKGKNDTSEPQVEDSSLPESAQESGSQSPRTKSAQPKKANRPGRPKRPVKKPG